MLQKLNNDKILYVQLNKKIKIDLSSG